MADIASQLLEFPPELAIGKTLLPEEYDKRAHDFSQATLGKLSQSKVAAADSSQNLLQIIDPTVNSLPYLYVLRTRLFDSSGKAKAVPAIDAALLNQTLEFLTKFDGVQMRYAGNEFRGLIEMLLQIVETAPLTHMTGEILIAIRTAIFRLDPSAGTMTSTHILFLRQCLHFRTWDIALPLLESTIHSFPPPNSSSIDGALPCHPHTDSTGYITISSGLTARISIADIQEYYLLGATTFIALRRWEDALLNLELVLTSPTSGSPSGLMVEAYQKWAIVGCLIHGRAPDAPKTIAAGILRSIKTCSKPYDTVVEAFTTAEIAKLQAEITAASSEFSADGNTGLVEQLLHHLPRFHLLRMQKTYSALPLSTVATWLGKSLDNVHAFIEELIDSQLLNARIELRASANQEPILRFFSDQTCGPLAKSEKEYTTELINQAARTNTIVDLVKMADRRLVLTKDYVEGLRKRMRNKDEDRTLAPDGGDPSWDPSYQDEDLMLES